MEFIINIFFNFVYTIINRIERVTYLKGIIDNLYNNRKQEKNKEQLKFCNFESREYDYDSLENALLYGVEENQDIAELLRNLKEK